MKNLTIILLAVLSFSVFNTQAAERSKTNSKPNSELTLDTSTEFSSLKVASKVPLGLKNAILSELSNNGKTYLPQGEVYLRLCIDNDNQVKIIEMNATNSSLRRYVSKQLSSTVVKKPGCKPGQVYMMKVNFDIE